MAKSTKHNPAAQKQNYALPRTGPRLGVPTPGCLQFLRSFELCCALLRSFALFCALLCPTAFRTTAFGWFWAPNGPSRTKNSNGIANYCAVVFLLHPPFLLRCEPLFEGKHACKTQENCVSTGEVTIVDHCAIVDLLQHSIFSTGVLWAGFCCAGFSDVKCHLTNFCTIFKRKFCDPCLATSSRPSPLPSLCSLRVLCQNEDCGGPRRVVFFWWETKFLGQGGVTTGKEGKQDAEEVVSSCKLQVARTWTSTQRSTPGCAGGVGKAIGQVPRNHYMTQSARRG